jgi:predicted TIM-barrel fold metal-dependent hydrolase
MGQMTSTVQETRAPRRTERYVVDADIHNDLPAEEALYPYLAERWRRHHAMFGLPGYAGAAYPRANPRAARADAWPPSGLPPGADLSFLRAQLLDTWQIEYGILNPLIAIDGPQVDYSAALARAVNDWQREAWLAQEPRLRASIVVPYQDSDLAAAEIDRLGADRRFAQVLLLARTVEPLGRRRFWKIYEAAVRHDLPIGIHFGGSGGVPITGAGWPSFYLEDHGGMPQAFQAQVISLVCEGVFVRYPTLKVVLIEGGFAWLPPLMWRLDRSWRRLREEVPHLREAPSTYIRRHFWLTTQPMEEPARADYFLQLLDQLGMPDRLVFATDYPHWDFDAPDQAFPSTLPPASKQRIMAGNAHALYRFVER